MSAKTDINIDVGLFGVVARPRVSKARSPYQSEVQHIIEPLD